MTGDGQRLERAVKVFTRPMMHDDALREHHAMRCLNELGYAAPVVHELEMDLAHLGHPFLTMERLRGRLLVSRLRDPMQNSERLMDEFFNLYARLHALDWRPFVTQSFGEDQAFLPVERWLARVAERRSPPRELGFAAALEWVGKHSPHVAHRRRAPLHGDFHPANVLVRDDGGMAVIDWPGFRIWAGP